MIQEQMKCYTLESYCSEAEELLTVFQILHFLPCKDLIKFWNESLSIKGGGGREKGGGKGRSSDKFC